MEIIELTLSTASKTCVLVLLILRNNSVIVHWLSSLCITGPSVEMTLHADVDSFLWLMQGKPLSTAGVWTVWLGTGFARLPHIVTKMQIVVRWTLLRRPERYQFLWEFYRVSLTVTRVFTFLAEHTLEMCCKSEKELHIFLCAH